MVYNNDDNDNLTDVVVCSTFTELSTKIFVYVFLCDNNMLKAASLPLLL